MHGGHLDNSSVCVCGQNESDESVNSTLRLLLKMSLRQSQQMRDVGGSVWRIFIFLATESAIIAGRSAGQLYRESIQRITEQAQRAAMGTPHVHIWLAIVGSLVVDPRLKTVLGPRGGRGRGGRGVRRGQLASPADHDAGVVRGTWRDQQRLRDESGDGEARSAGSGPLASGRARGRAVGRGSVAAREAGRGGRGRH